MFSDERLHSPSLYKKPFVCYLSYDAFDVFCSQIVLQNLNTWTRRAYWAYNGTISYPTVNSSSVNICISLLLSAEGQIINWYDSILAKSLNGPNVSQPLYTLNKAIIIHLFSAKLNFSRTPIKGLLVSLITQ